MNLKALNTEQKNTRTQNIDTLSSIEVLRLMNEEDKGVANAVEKELDHIAEAVDLIYKSFKAGGRLIYVGAGTSGRLGILDAVECPPTFGTDPELVQGVIAGGQSAIMKAVEGAEDSFELGEEDLKNIGFTSTDIVVGIAASGRTPYVIGAFKYAASIGASTVSVTCNAGSILEEMADIAITPLPGPEVVTGSTRLKSGTAQKMVLNMLTTAVMIKSGKVYGNLMVDVKATNEKLIERTVSIVRSVTDVSDETARETLKLCDYSAKTAIVMIKTDKDCLGAEKLIADADGHLSEILN